MIGALGTGGARHGSWRQQEGPEKPTPHDQTGPVSGGRAGAFVEEQDLTDQGLDHIGVERLGDQKSGFGALAGQQAFGEGGNEGDRHRVGVENVIDRVDARLPSAS